MEQANTIVSLSPLPSFPIHRTLSTFLTRPTVSASLALKQRCSGLIESNTRLKVGLWNQSAWIQILFPCLLDR